MLSQYPDGRPALTANSGTVGGNGGFELLDKSGAVDLGIGAQTQPDVFTQMDRCETSLHGRRALVTLSHQIRQLLAAQPQPERTALAWRPIDESQPLQHQSHLMD